MLKIDVEERVAAIEARNKKVEVDKAWETSWTRRISIAVVTYVSIVAYLFVIENDDPFVNGLVPVAGYLLSTLALPIIRNVWSRK